MHEDKDDYEKVLKFVHAGPAGHLWACFRFLSINFIE